MNIHKNARLTVWGREPQPVGWLDHYNWHRPHTSLGGRPPITRVLTADNLVRLHS
jgi:hypothetical protein